MTVYAVGLYMWRWLRLQFILHYLRIHRTSDGSSHIIIQLLLVAVWYCCWWWIPLWLCVYIWNSRLQLFFLLCTCIAHIQLKDSFQTNILQFTKLYVYICLSILGHRILPHSSKRWTYDKKMDLFAYEAKLVTQIFFFFTMHARIIYLYRTHKFLWYARLYIFSFMSE